MFWNLRHSATQPALISESGECWTYLQLAGGVDAFRRSVPASAGKQLGFILCQNNVASLVAYLGGLQRGDAVCLLDAKTDRGLLDQLIATYRPDWIAVSTDEATGRLEGNVVVLPMGLLYDRRTIHSANASLPGIHADLALLLPTSGTTGNAKMVRLSQSNLQANAESITGYLKLDRSERPITTLPMNYSYGLSVINSHLWCGATLLLTDQSVISRPFWNLFRQHGATSLAGVPYVYQVLRRMGIENMAVPSLRVLTQAGGRLDPKLVEHFDKVARARGWRFFVMYGATEATARMSYLPPEQAQTRPGSIGIPIPGGEFHITPSGELVYRGPNVMMGYAETREDLTRGDELQGVLHTGDLAERDAEGYYYIVGRMSRFLKLFGLRVNLDDVEKMVESKVQTPVACAGSDDKLWLFVEVESAVEIAKRILTETYHLHHTSFHIQVVSEISRNPNGKIAYQRLAEWIS